MLILHWLYRHMWREPVRGGQSDSAKISILYWFYNFFLLLQWRLDTFRPGKLQALRSDVGSSFFSSIATAHSAGPGMRDECCMLYAVGCVYWAKLMLSCGCLGRTLGLLGSTLGPSWAMSGQSWRHFWCIGVNLEG